MPRRELARIAGVPGSTITRYLSGERTITAPIAERISGATGGAVTIEELLYPNGIKNGARLVGSRK